jgi:hypothetical protein
MDYFFYQVGGVNGYDSLGHYLRAALIVNQCSNYATQPVSGCSANFTGASSTSAQAAAAASGDPTIVNTARALAGKKYKKVQPTPIGRLLRAAAKSARAARSPVPTPTPAPAANPSRTDALLDYLFGGEG